MWQKLKGTGRELSRKALKTRSAGCLQIASFHACEVFKSDTYYLHMSESPPTQNLKPLPARLQELGFRAREYGYLTWEDIYELLPNPVPQNEMELITKFLSELAVKIIPKESARKPWKECVSPQLLEEQNRIYESIDARVYLAIRGERRVKYAVYEWDENYLPIDNLDNIAEHGRVYFEENPTEDPDFPKPVWRSKILENPTWLQLAILANEMMITCGYEEHVYLEGVFEAGEESDGTRRLFFVLGS
jgi:hypothetical protein